MVKLISLDLDGTLLDHNRKLPEENKMAIIEAVSKGIEVIISTGSPYSLIPFGDLQELPINYAITANGSAIYEYKTGKCLYDESIETAEILPILKFLLSKDMHLDIFMAGKAYCPANTRETVYKLNVPQSRKDYILNNGRTWLDDTLSVVKNNTMTVQKITMNFYPDETGELVDRKEVKEFLDNTDIVKVVSGGWGNLEITKNTVNKGKALRILCEMLGITINDTMAIGDSLNDLDIIVAAGIGVAMGNAMEEVKSQADVVTLTNDECGVAKSILEQIRG